MVRINVKDYYMEIAEVVSLRSNCIKRKCGAVIVRENMIVSCGYNGTPKGIKNCDEGGCKRCSDTNIKSGTNLETCYCSHAEENAIVQAAYNGISTKDCEIYLTNYPCLQCSKLMINAGIKKIYYKEEYYSPETLPLLNEAKIKIYQLNKNKDIDNESEII